MGDEPGSWGNKNLIKFQSCEIKSYRFPRVMMCRGTKIQSHHCSLYARKVGWTAGKRKATLFLRREV